MRTSGAATAVLAWSARAIIAQKVWEVNFIIGLYTARSEIRNLESERTLAFELRLGPA